MRRRLLHAHHASAGGAAGAAWGLDPAPEAIARARKVTGAANCIFSEGVAEHLDASGDFYDVVVSSLMVHHLPEECAPRRFGRCSACCAPGGRVLIAEFCPPCNRIVRSLIGHVTSPAMQHNPLHLLEPMIEDAGFQHVHGEDVKPWIRYAQAVKPPRLHERSPESPDQRGASDASAGSDGARTQRRTQVGDASPAAAALGQLPVSTEDLGGRGLASLSTYAWHG
jgi:SAM-dependent methyltransferase